jgi:hypothetical protein
MQRNIVIMTAKDFSNGPDIVIQPAQNGSAPTEHDQSLCPGARLLAAEAVFMAIRAQS